jgi:hypothetical protein
LGSNDFVPAEILVLQISDMQALYRSRLTLLRSESTPPRGTSSTPRPSANAASARTSAPTRSCAPPSYSTTLGLLSIRIRVREVGDRSNMRGGAFGSSRCRRETSGGECAPKRPVDSRNASFSHPHINAYYEQWSWRIRLLQHESSASGWARLSQRDRSHPCRRHRDGQESAAVAV